MIITKSDPFTRAEIDQLKEQFEVYIKTVIDVEKKCVQQVWIAISKANRFYFSKAVSNKICGVVALT